MKVMCDFCGDLTDVNNVDEIDGYRGETFDNALVICNRCVDKGHYERLKHTKEEA